MKDRTHKEVAERHRKWLDIAERLERGEEVSDEEIMSFAEEPGDDIDTGTASYILPKPDVKD